MSVADKSRLRPPLPLQKTPQIMENNTPPVSGIRFAHLSVMKMKKTNIGFTLVELPVVSKCKGGAFTLVELLVVVAIIALLISILLPSLSRAKDITRETICLTRLGGQLRGLFMYAVENGDFLPTGPDAPMGLPMPPLPYSSIATNQLWIGDIPAYNGCGALIEAHLPAEEFFFCPGDNSSDPAEELAKLRDRGGQDAYGSYLYRQRDQAESARLDRLGRNDDGAPVTALLMDINSEMPGMPARHNHSGRRVNVGFADSHAAGFDNSEKVFTLREQDVFNPFGRLDEILKYADSLGR